MKRNKFKTARQSTNIKKEWRIGYPLLFYRSISVQSRWRKRIPVVVRLWYY